MYPFFTDIGKAKVSKVLEAMEFVSADYNLGLSVLPKDPIGQNKYLFIFGRHDIRIITRILRNNQRNN